jgi:hypothetical protein
VYLDQLASRGEIPVKIPVNDMRFSIGKMKTEPRGSRGRLGREGGDFFHERLPLFFGDQFGEEAARKRAPVRFESTVKSLVDEGQRGIGKEAADKVRTGLEKSFAHIDRHGLSPFQERSDSARDAPRFAVVIIAFYRSIFNADLLLASFASE